jgi:hypothetical protein
LQYRFSKRTDVSDPVPDYSSGLPYEKQCAQIVPMQVVAQDSISERSIDNRGGFPNLLALFALTDFHVFSEIRAALSCAEIASFAG